MAPKPLTEAELVEAVRLRAQHGSAAAAGRIAGLSEHAMRNRLKHAARAGMMGTLPVLPGFAIKSTSTQLSPDGTLQREWVRQAKEPGEVFEAPASHSVAGVSALVDSEGRVIQQWIKTRAESDDTSDLVTALREAFQSYSGRAQFTPTPIAADDDLLTTYFLPDVHLGQRSWARDAGENYDLSIATTRAREMASDLISQSRPSRHALVLGLGDLFHMNDRTNMTPRSGHILDADGRWPKILAAGVRLAMDIIELAAQRHEIVHVRFLAGNHDPDASVALTVALSLFYAGHPRIVIDDDPSLVFYHRFGSVLIGATHGHTMKPDQMAMMLASDRAEDWGATKHKHVFFGHIHHETAKEVGPVRVESFNTIAAKDAYAHSGGYRSGQSLNAITFHRHRGEIGRHKVHVTQDMKAAA